MTETTRMLALLNETFPDLAAMTPADARIAADARIRPAANLDDVARVEDVMATHGPDAVSVRIYHPHAQRDGAPVTVYAHGGGFLHGSVAGHDGFCRRWAKGTRSTVVSVEYRLAPEAAPPAARDDIVTAVEWARASGLAPHGVVVAGDSSGGNLAAGAAIVLRDRGDTPIIAQVLAYPFLDPSMSTPSHRSRAHGYFVTSDLLAYYWRHYLAGSSREAFAPEVTPLAVPDLSGLPSAVVITAGLDPLSDEGAQYAHRLRDAGVSVVHRHYPDQFHGFLTIPGYGPADSAAEVLWSDLQQLPETLEKESR